MSKLTKNVWLNVTALMIQLDVAPSVTVIKQPVSIDAHVTTNVSGAVHAASTNVIRSVKTFKMKDHQRNVQISALCKVTTM